MVLTYLFAIVRQMRVMADPTQKKAVLMGWQSFAIECFNGDSEEVSELENIWSYSTWML